MTDKIACVAYYQERTDVQLNKESFFVSMRGKGGISNYRVRFDDAPASNLRLATKIERDISAIELSAAEVRRMLQSKRLRISGLTILSTTFDFDADLSDIELAHGVLAGPECA